MLSQRLHLATPGAFYRVVIFYGLKLNTFQKNGGNFGKRKKLLIMKYYVLKI